jgi:hypothetical protein
MINSRSAGCLDYEIRLDLPEPVRLVEKKGARWDLEKKPCSTDAPGNFATKKP